MLFTLPFHPNKGKQPGDWMINGLMYLIWFGLYTLGMEGSKKLFDVPEVFHYFLAIPVLYVGFIAVGLFLGLMLASDPESIKAKQFKRKYRKENPDGIKFTDAEYKEAAVVLRKIKPIKYNKAIEKYSKMIVDLLLLSDSAMVLNKKVRRLGSIKAIEEDRAAGPDDE